MASILFLFFRNFYILVKYINVIEINRMPTQKITISFIIVSLNIVTGWVHDVCMSVVNYKGVRCVVRYRNDY